ncbi:tetratricopeptide repeat protein [Candidatus Sumerlaeota bacterium]|nr:tetratricopeptide repeat protein [Candidatus Sumerlaeota bacterium]
MTRKAKSRRSHKSKSILFLILENRLYSLVIIFFLVVITFANSTRNEFTYDDIPYIKDNKNVTSLKYLPKIFSEPYPPHMPELGLYRPIVEVSYMIDYALGIRHTELEALGLEPEIDKLPFHITNILIHFMVCVLVYVIALRLYSEHRLVAFMSAGIFAVMPAHVEVVASVVGRAESLATLFYLLSFYLVIVSPVDESYFSLKKLSAYLCFLLALLSKEMAITLPLVVGVYLVLFRRDEIKRASAYGGIPGFLVLYLLPYVCVFLMYIVTRINVVGYVGIAEEGTYFAKNPELPPVASMLIVFLAYLKLMIFPDVLHIDYNFPLPIFDGVRIPAPTGILAPLPLLGLFVLLLWLGLGVYLFIRRNKLAFLLLWFPVTLFPVSNIIPFGDIMAERFLYLPSVGFCILIGWVFSRFILLHSAHSPRLNRQTQIALAVFVIVMLAMMYRCIKRNADWKDSVALWNSVERVDPDNYDLHYALGHAYQELRKYYLTRGNIYQQLGQLKRAQQYLRLAEKYENLAIKSYYTSIEKHPRYYESYHNLAELLAEAKHPNLAEAARLEKFLVDSALPDNWKHIDMFNYALGAVYVKMKKWDKALTYFRRAIRFNPNKMDYYNNVGAALASLGHYQMAEKFWRYVLSRDPFNEAAEKNLKRLENLKRLYGTNPIPPSEKFKFSTKTPQLQK